MTKKSDPQFAGLAWSLGATAITAAASFAAAAIVARSLGPTGRGAVAIIQVAVSYAHVAFYLSLPESCAVLWSRHSRRGGIRTGIAAAATSGIASIALGIAGWATAAPESANGEWGSFLLGIGMIPFWNASVAMSLSAAGAGRVRTFHLTRSLQPLAQAGLVSVAMIWGGRSVGAFFAAALASHLLATPVIAMSAFRADHTVFARSEFSLRNLLQIGWGLHLGLVLAVVAGKVEQAVGAVLLGPRELGIYTVALSYSGAVSIVTGAVSQEVLAQSILGGRRIEKGTAKKRTALFPGVLLLAIASAAILPIAKVTLAPLFGAAYAEALNCIPFLAIGACGNGVALVLSNIAKGRGDGRVGAAAGLGGVVSLLAAIVLAERGAVGLAAANGLGGMASMVAAALFHWRRAAD